MLSTIVQQPAVRIVGTTWFDQLTANGAPQLRRAFVAHYGLTVGGEVHADAMAYAWEHRDRLAAMANPLFYLYRVGQTAARKHHRWRARIDLPAERGVDDALPEPGLQRALLRLRTEERVAVVLVHGFGVSYADAAELMGVPLTTIRNHVHRGTARLRRMLGEPT